MSSVALKLSVSHATRPKVGETANGDAAVSRREHARSLVAVIDALGHGPIAADVARRACEHLESVSLESDVEQIVTGLHRALRGTRGAAAMVCLLDEKRLEGCGVGNVDLRVQGSSIPTILSPGVLGGMVRSFRAFHGELRSGSRLALFSDGISSRFTLDHVRTLAPADAVARIMELHGYSHDDATVLIADVS